MLKDALLDTWQFFRLHYLAFSAIILPILIPVEILTTLYQMSIESKEFNLFHVALPIIFKVAISPLYSVGVIFYLSTIINGEMLDTKAAWQLGIKYWTPYFILSILVGLLVGTGLMLLIIPGVVLLVRFSFAEFELLLNNNHPLDAMKNSWYSTREFMFEILAGFTIIAIFMFVPYFTILSYFKEVNTWYWIVSTVFVIFYGVLEVLFTIFAFRIYDHTREKNKYPI